MYALRAAVEVQSFTNRLATTIRRQSQLPRLPIIERHRRRPGLRSRQCPMQRTYSDVPGRRPGRYGPPKPALHNDVARTRGRRGNGKRSDPDRPDPAISSADNAAGTQESARRNRADADLRRGHAVLRHHPGGTAHGVSQQRRIPKPRRQSVAPLL
jgi:hypothetical protein